MPITYLDDEPKGKITYLDEEPPIPQQEPKPQVSPLEQQISQRPDIYKQAVQAIQKRFTPEEARQSFTLPQEADIILKSLGGVAQRGEAAIANPFLRKQGRFQNPLTAIKEGITGEQLGELGDVIRQAPVVRKVPLLPEIGGLVGTGILGGSISKWAGLTQKAQGLMKLETTYGKDISKNIIKHSTGLSDEAVEWGQTKGWKNILIKENLNPQKGYNLVLKAKKGLQNFYRGINKHYREELDKIASNVDVDLPVENIKTSLQQRLQNAGILDFQGQEVRAPIDKVEKEILRIHNGLKDIKGNIGLKDILQLKNRLWEMVRKTALEGNQPINSSERIIYDLQGEIGRALQMAGEILPSDKSILSLNQLNSWYAQNRTLFNMSNNIFKVFKNDYATKGAENVFNRYFNLDIGTKQLLQELENRLPENLKFLEPLKDWLITQEFLIKPSPQGFSLSPFRLLAESSKGIVRQSLRSGIPSKIGKKTGQIINRPNLIPASILKIITRKNQGEL